MIIFSEIINVKQFLKILEETHWVEWLNSIISQYSNFFFFQVSNKLKFCRALNFDT